jgi:hydrogenase expression/formation protein HypC
MCLAIPGKIINIEGTTSYVEFGSIKRKVDLRLLSDVAIGDYVMVHAGFAIEKLDKEEAIKTLSLFNDITIPFDELT